MKLIRLYSVVVLITGDKFLMIPSPMIKKFSLRHNVLTLNAPTTTNENETNRKIDREKKDCAHCTSSNNKLTLLFFQVGLLSSTHTCQQIADPLILNFA